MRIYPSRTQHREILAKIPNPALDYKSICYLEQTYLPIHGNNRIASQTIEKICGLSYK